MNALVQRSILTLALAAVGTLADAQVVIVPAPYLDGSGIARGTVTVPTGSALQIAMAQPSTLAATPSQLGTDLAAGVYTITVTALDAGGGQTDDPTAITCTVAAGGAGRCALTWDAVPGAVSYRAWTSLVGVATPTRYFAASTNSYNLDTLTGATVATLPTSGSAYVVYLSPTAASWALAGSWTAAGFGLSALGWSATAPTVTGFGTDPSVAASNGTAAFTINVGTGGTASTGTVNFPTATTGWVVSCYDVTTPASFVTSQTGGTATTATVTNYSRTTGLAIAWTASDVLRCHATAY